MFAVYDYFFSVLVFRLQQSVKQKLDGFERLTIASDDPPTFLGINLQCRITPFIHGFLDLHDKTEITKHGVEQVFRRHHRFRFAGVATFSKVGIGSRLFW